MIGSKSQYVNKHIFWIITMGPPLLFASLASWVYISMVNSILEFSLYVLMYHAALMMMLSIFYNSISKARGFFKYLYNSIKVENSNYTYNTYIHRNWRREWKEAFDRSSYSIQLQTFKITSSSSAWLKLENWNANCKNVFRQCKKYNQVFSPILIASSKLQRHCVLVMQTAAFWIRNIPWKYLLLQEDRYFFPTFKIN